MRLCDPDECLYADGPTPEGCDRKVCPEHDPDEVVAWNDGADTGWLHARGTCPECDRCWQDVDANTAYYAGRIGGDFTVTLRFHFPTAEARAAWRSENRALLERVAIEVDASVSPEQTPSATASSPDSSDHSTVGETP